LDLSIWTFGADVEVLAPNVVPCLAPASDTAGPNAGHRVSEKPAAAIQETHRRDA